jgi:hypothetical protein
MVLTVYGVLTPERLGLFVSVACKTPSRKLDTCHLGARPARFGRPLTHCTSDNAFASIASRLTIVTTRSPHFIEAERGQET